MHHYEVFERVVHLLAQIGCGESCSSLLPRTLPRANCQQLLQMLTWPDVSLHPSALLLSFEYTPVFCQNHLSWKVLGYPWHDLYPPSFCYFFPFLIHKFYKMTILYHSLNNIFQMSASISIMTRVIMEMIIQIGLRISRAPFCEVEELRIRMIYRNF